VSAIINYMTAREFQTEGYLHEVNRQLLHPLGLALEVYVPKKKLTLRDRLRQTWRFWHRTKGDGGWVGGVWDYRDDPEGMVYGEGLLNSEKARHIAALVKQRAPERVRLLGYMTQPIDKPYKEKSDNDD
jgi:hypothetical protein